jgi:hypothetical protein
MAYKKQELTNLLLLSPMAWIALSSTPKTRKRRVKSWDYMIVTLLDTLEFNPKEEPKKEESTQAE